MIFGRPGSGKSTFAYKLSLKTGRPVHHLDKHFFISGWIERDTQAFMRIQKEITRNSRWIIDGNNTRSLETRWKKADLVLYFNYSKIRCFFRLIKRLFSKADHIDDRADNCPEVLKFKLIKYMWTFENRVASTIEKLREKYPVTKFIEIQNQKDLNKVEAMLLKNVTPNFPGGETPET